MFWRIGNVSTCDNGAIKAMQELRKDAVQEEIQRKAGRLYSFQEAAILLADLCQHTNRIDSSRIFMACAETLKDEVRSVRRNTKITSASYRSGYLKQRPGKHTDFVQVLPRFLAFYGKAHWQDGSWEDAVPRVAKQIPNRVDRLRAIGNGQVPAVAAAAWRLLTETPQ